MSSPRIHPDPGSPSSAEESALLARVSDGDREAFRRLYVLYHRRLHRFLMRLIHEPQLCEEIINDTMLVVWRHAADFRGASQVSTWILGIAYRRALKTLQRTRNARAVHFVPVSAEALEASALDALMNGAEIHNWVDAALDCLTPEHRLVLELAYFLGLSCEEIATIAGCPVGTVKTRMFYGRERLRDALVTLALPRKDSAS
jgi:RNA polymerase sigma-70 factor (ECF subfamily)